MSNDRSSEADQPRIVADPKDIARIEAENTLRQFDDSMSELAKWLSSPGYELRLSTILRFNRIALYGVSAYAGTFRPGTVKISGSTHTPPGPEHVPELMEEFCDYIRSNWTLRSAIHLSAYALWRLNWIHPFVDGNGRTARTVSYLILCAKLRYRLPGRQTIPEQIAADTGPYYAGLESGDRAYEHGKVDVSAIEELIETHLARQLVGIYDAATQTGIDRQAVSSAPMIVAPSALPAASRGRNRFVDHIERHPVIYSCAVAILVGLLAIVFR